MTLKTSFLSRIIYLRKPAVILSELIFCSIGSMTYFRYLRLLNVFSLQKAFPLTSRQFWSHYLRSKCKWMPVPQHEGHVSGPQCVISTGAIITTIKWQWPLPHRAMLAARIKSASMSQPRQDWIKTYWYFPLGLGKVSQGPVGMDSQCGTYE